MDLSPWNKLLNDEACVGERDISCQGSSCEGKHGFPSPKCCPGERIQTSSRWDYVGLERKKTLKAKIYYHC